MRNPKCVEKKLENLIFYICTFPRDFQDLFFQRKAIIKGEPSRFSSMRNRKCLKKKTEKRNILYLHLSQ